MARGAHALGGVEGKHLGRRFPVGNAAGRAVEIGAEKPVLLAFARYDQAALAHAQGIVHSFFQAGRRFGVELEAVDHDLNAVAAVAVQLRGLGQVENAAVHPHSQVARFL